jgi:hypothetical protein
VSIGGTLDTYGLARLMHRPDDRAALKREAERLSALGWTHDDVAAALGLSRQAVRLLLEERL